MLNEARLPGWLFWIARLGALPEDDDETRFRKGLFNVSLSGALLFLTIESGLYFVFDEPAGGLVIGLFVLYVFSNLVVYSIGHGNLDRLIFWAAIVTLPAHLALHCVMGGFVNSAAVILWGLLFPVVGSMLFQGLRTMPYWFAAYLLNVMLAFYLEPRLDQSTNLPDIFLYGVLAVQIAAISAFITVIMALFINQRDTAYRLLRGEQVKAENLLLNILPAEIASILKNENRTIAEHYDGASVLFADVVNFTPMSATMTPVELVNLLNEVFSYFDTLTEKYGMEKIKTIGDCYMVASGVPRPRSDHAQTLVRMALEMQRYVEQNTFNGRRLNFRIGINSGPVVAGVIGRKKFIYDLWGDAVNTASRMESHGSGGTIQVTQETYNLIKGEFVCEPRGLVHVKGKGEMHVYFVVAERPELSEATEHGAPAPKA